MKLLILSRAPYDGDRTKTCSNDRAVNSQRLEDASPYTCENTQQTNQMLTSHTDGLTERTSTIDSIINHSPAVYGAADNSHNMQSCDEVYKETRPRLLTGDAYDSLPLDLSGFKETSNSPQCRPPESCRNSESPLDLSVKTRKSIADSTYVNSVNNVTVPRPISMETQFYRNFEQSEKCQKVERRNETILKNTQEHKRTENNAPYIRNGFRCYLDSQPVKGDHRNLISHISHGQVQSSNSNKADLFSFDRSSQKQICYNQPLLHRHHSSEVRRGFVNKSDNSRNRSGFQKYSFSDPHSLRVSPHAVLTPSSSLPCSPHSASTSPYLVPSSPRGYFSETTSPELSSASSHTELPNQISLLQDTEKRIGENDNGRSRVFQSNVPVTKPSVLRQVEALTPPLRSQLPPSIEAQLPVNVDKLGTLNKDHNNLYIPQPPCHHEGKTSRSTEYFTPVSETERSRRNLSPPETRSPPTLSIVSPVIKPGNEAHESPMPVLSPHNTSPPGKTSAPPPLISFNTQRKPMYNNKIHYSSTQFESFKQYYITDNKKTSALRDGHKSVNSLHSEYGYDDIIGQKRKDIAGNSGARYSANVGNGKKFKLANHSRMNPFQQRSLAEYSETYRQQLLLRGVSAKHRSPPNSVPEPRPPAIENRYNVNRLLHCERKTHSDATNASPESKTVPIPPRSGYQTNNHNNTSSLMKTTENILKYFSKENVHWNQSEVNTDRQMSVKQSSASTADMRVSAGDAVHQYRKQSVNAPVQSTKSTENFIGSHCSNDNDSGRGKFKDVNPKSHLGNLLLPFMIYGQVLLSGSQSNTDRQHSNTTNVEASIRNKVNSVNDWNNTTIDLTECDTVTSEPADNTDETNRSTGKAEIRSDTQPENNRDRTFKHDTKTDTEGKDTSVMLDSYKCLNGNLYLENISFGKNNTHAREKFEICNNTHLEYNCDHNSDHDTKTNTEYKDTSVNLDSCKYLNGNLESMAFGKSTDQITDIKENDQNRVEKKPDDSSTLSISANDESFDDDSEEFPPNDEVKNKTPLDSADDLASKDTLSLQVVFNKKEQLDSELKSNKDSDMPMVTSCQSLQPKGNLLSGRLSVKCSPEYKKMCPLMKKVSLSLEKEMQRRTTGVHSRSQMSTCKILKNESEINRNDITIAGDVHVDAKVNMDNHDAFDFCESENEDSQSGRPRFQSIKRFAGSKRASLEISGRKESDGNPKQRRSINREESPVTELTKPVPKDNPKQKKRKKLDVYQQIKAVGKRKRKYQTRKTILRCKQNDHEDRAPSVERSYSDITNSTRTAKRKKSRFVGVSSDSTLRTRSQSLCALVTRSRSQVKALDGRRPRKRYHKNEAYEEELAREEHRKAMLRAKRRQRQQEDDKPDDVTLCSKRRHQQEHDKLDDVTLCAKRRQRQQDHDKRDDVTLCATRRQRQEHDKLDDVTLCAKRRQRQQEHDKSSLCPDDVITTKNSLENQEMENIQNNTDMIHRRPVGRPPKNNKKCNIKNEVKERRPVGRPRKLAFKPTIFQTKSKLAQKTKQEEKKGYWSLRGYDVNQDLSNTASGPDLDGQVDQLLSYENITQEGVSDDVLYLSSYIKDETKDDCDFADDATIIYDMDDTPEVHYSEVESLPLSGILSFPPDLKRLQVNKNVGETVLHRAARLGCEDVIVYCLETGLIDVNVKDHGGYTALHECCVRGNLDVAKRLIAYGANVNSSAQDGTRPIHDAVACNRMEMVRLLLSSGADPTLATYSGRTCAKIAHTKEMKEFLRGNESDLNGGEAEDVCWEFQSSSILETANDQGFDIFNDVPTDDDLMDLEPHFDIWSQPHLPVYTLQLEADEGPSNYHLLKDVLNNMQMNRNEFFNLCGNVSIVTVTCDVFNRHLGYSQLLVSPWQHNLSGNDSKRNIQYVELVRLNDNLRKHLYITKDSLSSGLSSKKSCEHLDDSDEFGASYSDSISGDFYQVHNQSRDSYPSGFSDFLYTPEIESELICGWNDPKVTCKSMSKETPNISPLREDRVHKNLTNVHVEFTKPERAESHITSVMLTTTTQTCSHAGGNNTASISPMKGSTLKLANTTRGCFRDSNVSGPNNPTSDRHRSSPATGEDACTLKVAQECMMRDSIIGTEFQAQQTTHSVLCNHQKHN